MAFMYSIFSLFIADQILILAPWLNFIHDPGFDPEQEKFRRSGDVQTNKIPEKFGAEMPKSLENERIETSTAAHNPKAAGSNPVPATK